MHQVNNKGKEWVMLVCAVTLSVEVKSMATTVLLLTEVSSILNYDSAIMLQHILQQRMPDAAAWSACLLFYTSASCSAFPEFLHTIA